MRRKVVGLIGLFQFFLNLFDGHFDRFFRFNNVVFTPKFRVGKASELVGEDNIAAEPFSRFCIFCVHLFPVGYRHFDGRFVSCVEELLVPVDLEVDLTTAVAIEPFAIFFAINNLVRCFGREYFCSYWFFLDEKIAGGCFIFEIQIEGGIGDGQTFSFDINFTVIKRLTDKFSLFKTNNIYQTFVNLGDVS